MSDEGALVLRESWGGAAERGLQARKERQNIIEQVLLVEVDYGVIPGTKKPTLLKPGAEKIIDSLNLWPDYYPMVQLEDFQQPLFFYRYRCTLRSRGSDLSVSTGIGSCNSMEDRYRWRTSARACPQCGQEAIIKGKDEYGGGWLCYGKKGGCGAKYLDGDKTIEEQTVGRIANEDIFSLVNTVDKMAQKRALVAASLNLGFSDRFTQDVEDEPEAHGFRGGDRGGDRGSEEPPPIGERQARGPAVGAGPGKPTEPLRWIGTLESVVKKDAINPTTKATYSIWTFKGKDGKQFGTFSSTMFEKLRQAMEAGIEIEIAYSVTKANNWKVEDFRATEAGGEL